MDNKYHSAKRICLDALWDFRCDVNEYLPDNPESADLVFTGADWDLKACAYIQHCIDRVVDIILSTCMADHVSYELHCCQDAYAAALKEKDIRRCQRALLDFMDEARIIHAVCKAIPEDDCTQQLRDKTA